MEKYVSTSKYADGTDIEITTDLKKYVGCSGCTMKICDADSVSYFIGKRICIPYDAGLFDLTQKTTFCKCTHENHLICRYCEIVLGHRIGEFAQIKANVFVQLVSTHIVKREASELCSEFL